MNLEPLREALRLVRQDISVNFATTAPRPTMRKSGVGLLVAPKFTFASDALAEIERLKPREIQVRKNSPTAKPL